MKKCYRCLELVPFENFSVNNAKKDGLHYYCKSCMKKYLDSNKEDRKKKRIKYIQENKQELLKKGRNYNKKNRHKKKQWRKTNKNTINGWRLDNKKLLSEKAKKYYEKNKEKIKLRNKIYQRNKRKEDSFYRFKATIRSRISTALISKGYYKKTNIMSIVGCDFEFLLNHLNNNKYDFKISNKNIDLDHIIPISKAKNEKEVLKLNHYTNLQLLPSKYNRDIKKAGKFNRNHLENWIKNV